MRWLLPFVALMLGGAGWHAPSDQTGSLPSDWSHEVWSTPVANGSWSTPVVFGERVYLTAEPTRLLCLDLASGALLWERDNPIASMLPADERTAFEARAAQMQTLDAEITALRKTMETTRKNIRRGTATRKDMAPLRASMQELQSKHDALAPFFTPPRTDGLGYAVPTPHVDAQGVIASFGNGAVVATAHDGTVRWKRWLGVGAAPSHGYHGTDTASVVRHDDTVLIAHGSLVALDAATGATRWTGPAYIDFGTPVVVPSPAGAMVVTPDGHVLDLKTGTKLAEGIGALWYLGPSLHKGELWWLGRADQDMDSPVRFSRSTLSRTSAGLDIATTTPMDLPANDRLYAHPLFVGDHALIFTARGQFLVIDAKGAVLQQRTFDGLEGQIWSRPTRIGDHIVVTTHEGQARILEASAPYAEVRTVDIPKSLATPAFVGSSVVARDGDGIQRRGR